MPKDMILITGSNGQIGTVLTETLRSAYGSEQVIASDIRLPIKENGLFEILDVLDKDRMAKLVSNRKITQIYHLAAILSAKGEEKPLFTWNVNMNGLFNVLETARELGVQKLFFPSSIAVFGSKSPKQHTEQWAYLDPETVYGISKVAAENWCQYYYQKYGLDIRSVRYPGIISYQSEPGGGTTDYAVDIFHKAVKGESYSCFLKEDTGLPMMYMPDAVRATLEIMEAPEDAITVRTSYNIAAMSFTPAQLTEAIRKHVPGFIVEYKPDFRQKIAESWAQSVDDQLARTDWNWNEEYDLNKMTADMLHNLKLQYVDSVES